MPPERLASDYSGESFKDIIGRTLFRVSLVEAGFVSVPPEVVATSQGAMPILPANTKFIRRDIRNTWGATWPELFGKVPEPKTANFDDFHQTEHQLHRPNGSSIRIWNLLGRYATSPENTEFRALFDESFERISIDVLQALYNSQQLLVFSGYGKWSDKFVESLIELKLKEKPEEQGANAGKILPDSDPMGVAIPENFGRALGARACGVEPPEA